VESLLNLLACAKGLCAQAQLLDSLFGTERGLSASSEVRAEINELITQLEAKSPNSDMSEVGYLLTASFRLSLPIVLVKDQHFLQQAGCNVYNVCQSLKPLGGSSGGYLD